MEYCYLGTERLLNGNWYRYVINGRMKLTLYLSTRVYLVKRQRYAFCRMFDLKLIRVHQAQVIFKPKIIYSQTIIDVPVRV